MRSRRRSLRVSIAGRQQNSLAQRSQFRRVQCGGRNDSRPPRSSRLNVLLFLVRRDRLRYCMVVLFNDPCGLSMRKDFQSPIYRKSRVAARLFLKARSGRALSPRQRRLADALAKDSGVTPRLIQQGINQLCRKELIWPPRRVIR
jgi:hypothetical protein